MANQFALEIVTPENIFYNDQVEMVIMRTTNGDRAILKDHIPFVSPLITSCNGATMHLILSSLICKH